MSNPQVFIPQVPARLDPLAGRFVPVYDVTRAEQFGTLVPLQQIGERPVSSYELNRAIKAIQRGLEAMAPQDSILLMGDPILIAAALADGCRRFGTVTALKWDKSTRTYQKLEVTL